MQTVGDVDGGEGGLYEGEGVSAGDWTGRVSLTLTDYDGTRLAIIELAVRRDDFTVWQDNRTLAVIHREPFRAWLARFTGALETDDLHWESVNRSLVLTYMDADGRLIQSPLYPEYVDWLAAVI
jgi:hypothetical protein